MRRLFIVLAAFVIYVCPGNVIAKTALIFGVTGQDGSYLAEFLLEKGYEVHGVKRRSSSLNTSRIDHIYQDPHERNRRFFLYYGDVTDFAGICDLIRRVKPDEIYNLAAQSHVRISFDLPRYTSETTALGALNILEAIRSLGLSKKIRFYQASSSEMYGKVVETPQTETTPFHPRSPYAVAKVYAYWTAVNYREAYDIFACNGILFNHESPRRDGTFVTKKITVAVSRIKYGLQEKLYLGNLDAYRDWGYAKDYVEAMWLMLQQEEPDDYVVGTGETHSVREFVEKAFKEVGILIRWEGSGVDEKGIDTVSGKVLVEIDPKYFRPAEVDLLLSNPEKAKEKLKWSPRCKFDQLVSLMMQEDLKEAKLEHDTRIWQATVTLDN